MNTTVDNSRTAERVASNSTVMIHGLPTGTVPAIVIDESFGGLGVAAPIQFEAGQAADVELTIDMDGVRNTAIVRHVSALPSGCRLGLEWKAQAVSRCLRDLLKAEKSSQNHQQLVRILPGGLSMMWKLYEAERWPQLLNSADRLRKEAAACSVNELSAPIERFHTKVGEAVDSASPDAGQLIEAELNKLIWKCIEVIS